MGYLGGWKNLSKSLDNTPNNIASAKKRGRTRSPKKVKINEAAKNRTRISLVELHKKELIKVRITYTLMLTFVAILIYFL